MPNRTSARAGELRFAEPDLWGTWRTAFPTRSGELLNLRDLEQGLEPMKRVSRQDVDMQVVPTATPGVAMSSLQSNGANGGFAQNAAVGYLQGLATTQVKDLADSLGNGTPEAEAARRFTRSRAVRVLRLPDACSTGGVQANSQGTVEGVAKWNSMMFSASRKN